MHAFATAAPFIAILAAGSGAGTPSSTFREGRATCRHCNIEALVRKEAGEGALNCGWAKSLPEREAVNACVQRAIAAKNSFYAVTATNGIDNDIWIGLAGRSGSLRKFEYMDDVTGGFGVCEGVTWSSRCSGLHLRGDLFQPRSRPPSVLDCTHESDRKVVCRECATKRFVLGAAEDASAIRCRVVGKGRFSCDRTLDDPEQRPAPGGLRLLCEGLRHGMLCKPEGSTAPSATLRDGCRK